MDPVNTPSGKQKRTCLLDHAPPGVRDTLNHWRRFGDVFSPVLQIRESILDELEMTKEIVIEMLQSGASQDQIAALVEQAFKHCKRSAWEQLIHYVGIRSAIFVAPALIGTFVKYLFT